MASIRALAMRAQKELANVTPGLVVDGNWGRFTEAAYQQAPESVKVRIRTILEHEGTSPERLAGEFRQRKALSRDLGDAGGQPPANLITFDEAKTAVHANASRLGLGQHAVAFDEFLRREAAPMKVNGKVVGYNVASRNGSSRGLMQMQPAAWADAQKVDPTIGNYSNVWDPDKNIRAGMAYAKINIKAIEKAGFPVNAETLYLAHNQGAGFFTKGARTAVENQSKEVQALIAKYSKTPAKTSK